MHKIVYKIHEYLEKAARGEIVADAELLKEFGERVQAKLKKQLEEEKAFRLRMSNIGRPLRQIMLEQKYGKEKRNPELMLKMTFGDLYEALLLYLLKAAGLNVVEYDVEVRIPVQTAKGLVNLDGTLDICIRIEEEDGIWDIKTASPYSFDNKFDGTSLLAGKDDFGYVEQLFSYAHARGKKAKGWIVINKVTGEIKVDEIPPNLHDELMAINVDKIKGKVCHIIEGKPIPECTGIIDEVYYGKKTGNRILGPSCRFCNHKDKCHKDMQYMPSVVSKAKDKKWEYYIGEVKQ